MPVRLDALLKERDAALARQTGHVLLRGVGDRARSGGDQARGAHCAHLEALLVEHRERLASAMRNSPIADRHIRHLEDLVAFRDRIVVERDAQLAARAADIGSLQRALEDGKRNADEARHESQRLERAATRNASSLTGKRSGGTHAAVDAPAARVAAAAWRREWGPVGAARRYRHSRLQRGRRRAPLRRQRTRAYRRRVPAHADRRRVARSRDRRLLRRTGAAPAAAGNDPRQPGQPRVHRDRRAGTASSRADVVLSDTLVTAGWLEDWCVAPELPSADREVTPLNNARFLLVPRFCEDNPWPSGAHRARQGRGADVSGPAARRGILLLRQACMARRDWNLDLAQAMARKTTSACAAAAQGFRTRV